MTLSADYAVQAGCLIILGIASLGSCNEDKARTSPPLADPSSAPASARVPFGAGSGFLPSERSLVAPSHPPRGRDRFAPFRDNPVAVAAEQPVSTFSIDVDTASYGFIRSSLERGVLPQPDAARVEEMVNYFPYDYTRPADRDTPFATTVTLTPTPWNRATKLLHIGIQGYDLAPKSRPDANLVFLIDTSGSMNAANRLPLVKRSFKLLVDELQPDDRVAIMTYAGSAGVALEPTEAADRGTILARLDSLRAGGSTAGGDGLWEAYALAQRSFVKGGVNRVILATDGDFNVGVADTERLKAFVQRKRESGVFLSVLGFGAGNYNDALMQALAQNGNGCAAYIDKLSEARKVLVEEATSTLFPIAKDVKIQVEFNPERVSEYRLIGYETRLLAREDFRNDKVDAGEIGAGRAVTALYEVTPKGSSAERVGVLRYFRGPKPTEDGKSDEYAFVRIRYKLPESAASQLIERPVTAADEVSRAGDAPADARFSAAVAAFGQILRGGTYTDDYDYDDVIDLAQGARGEDPFGYRAEFVNLVRLARTAAPLERMLSSRGPGAGEIGRLR